MTANKETPSAATPGETTVNFRGDRFYTPEEVDSLLSEINGDIPKEALMEPPRYRFRAGALDHIMRTRRLDTDEQLAAAIGVKPEDLPRLRSGAMVTARLALKVAALQGDSNYLSGYFDPVFDYAAA